MAALAVSAFASSASVANAQSRTAASAATPAVIATADSTLVVGSVAPDFSLPGATRYGLLQRPIHLADYRGETVVLAFFYQARSKG